MLEYLLLSFHWIVCVREDCRKAGAPKELVRCKDVSEPMTESAHEVGARSDGIRVPIEFLLVQLPLIFGAYASRTELQEDMKEIW